MTFKLETKLHACNNQTSDKKCLYNIIFTLVTK